MSSINILVMHSTTTKFIMMLVLMILLMKVSINIVEGFPKLHDDDCLNIEMRPVPRFGKRFDSGLNTPTKRACIVSRRQTKSLAQAPLPNNNDSIDEPGSIANAPQQQFPFIIYWWRRFLDRISNEQQRQHDQMINKAILFDKLLSSSFSKTDKRNSARDTTIALNPGFP